MGGGNSCGVEAFLWRRRPRCASGARRCAVAAHIEIPNANSQIPNPKDLRDEPRRRGEHGVNKDFSVRSVSSSTYHELGLSNWDLDLGFGIWDLGFGIY